MYTHTSIAENSIPPWGLPDEAKTCGNCAHWDTASTAAMGIPPIRRFGICGCMAIEPDAGHGALVLLGPASDCRQHADAWKPSRDFLETLRQAAVEWDVA